jgi:hypothetical protein
LSCAKRDIAAGDKSLRSAAEHIAAAIESGSTQVDAAATVGKSQPWVNRLLKWRSGGFSKGGPFAADNAKANISRTNKAAKSKPHETKSDARAKADFARAEAEKAKAEAAKVKAEAAKAKAERVRAKHAANEARTNARAEEARAKAEWKRRFHSWFDPNDEAASIPSSDRLLMVKALGMLGSIHDGEILNAARTVERLRQKLNATWEQLIVKASATRERKAA